MEKKIDPMSPDASPAGLQKVGVRRVNNVPLLIAMGLALIFVLLIAMVFSKKSQEQKVVRVTPKVVHTVDSSVMANDIVSGHGSGIIPSLVPKPLTKTQSRVVLPVALVDDPNAPPGPPRLRTQSLKASQNDPEMERIRNLKIEEFEKAVKASTRMELPNLVAAKETQRPLTPNEALVKLTQAQRQIDEIEGGDLNTRYQARLAELRANMKENGSSNSHNQALGGSEEDESRWTLNSKLQAPQTPYVLRVGGVIPGVMIDGIQSELAGPITGQVSQNIYDTATGRHLLIPQGSKMSGIYSNEILFGQETLLVAWQRITFPDAKALDIGSMPGADSAGYAGFHDQVNNHYLKIYGSALLMSAIVGGVTYSQNQNSATDRINSAPTAGSVMSAALGQQLGEVSMELIKKNIDIAPGLKIRPGYQFQIKVVKDLVFDKPYQAFDY